MNKEQAKKTFKIALLVYAIAFLVFNWNDVSWIFNYKAVYGMVDEFFNPYPSINASAMDKYFYPNHSQGSAVTIKEAKISYTDKQNTLEIPKISILAPVVFSSAKATEEIEKDLESGVVYIPGSVYPGQTGQIVILGHSAPLGWPKIKYDWVFSNLDKLTAGDEISIHLNNKKYTYIVKKTTIIKAGQEIPVDSSLKDTSALNLISCWPPGKDYQRIVVQTELLVN